MKKIHYILIGLFSYLFFTLGNIPAAKIVSLAEQNMQLPVKLYGVQGSIWNGSASKAILPGQPEISNLEWSINPASLLLAKLGGEVKATVKNQNIVGNISINAFGEISASSLRARIEAPVMQQLLQLPLGELGGIFNINIESLQLKPEGLPLITGKLKWKNAKLTLIDTVNLGFIDLDIQTDDDNQLVLKISSKKGQLKLDGKASIDSNKMYDIDLRITPEKKANQQLRQSIAMFARRQSNGSYLLKRKGNLQQIGF